MGTTPSKTLPTARLQVIGAGLPRTGTASFAAALEILVDGPVYHAGIQHILSYPSEKPMRKAMDLLSNHKSPTVVKRILASMFNSGWVATVDAPFAQFTPELMELYPEAVVICTVRDPAAWGRSVFQLSQAGKTATGLHTALVPIARLFPQYTHLLATTRWKELYPDPATTYEDHIDWLKSVVPEEKLFFYDVKDGWEPLCKALGLPVPKDVPLPKVNDGEEIKKLARKFVIRGIVRWILVLSVMVALVAIGWQWLRS